MIMSSNADLLKTKEKKNLAILEEIRNAKKNVLL